MTPSGPGFILLLQPFLLTVALCILYVSFWSWKRGGVARLLSLVGFLAGSLLMANSLSGCWAAFARLGW